MVNSRLQEQKTWSVPGFPDRLESEITGILATTDMRQKIASYGYVTGGTKSSEFRRQLAAEIRQWQEVVRTAGIPRQ